MGICVGKEQCPKCSEEGRDRHGDNLAIYDDGSKYCFSCSYSESGNSDLGVKERKLTGVNRDLEKFNEKKLNKETYYEAIDGTTKDLTCNYRGLNPALCKELGVLWKIENNEVVEMLFPATYLNDGKIKVSGYKVRKVPKNFYSKGYVGKLNLMAGQTQHVANVL